MKPEYEEELAMVVEKNLEGFEMKMHESPETHHLDGLEIGKDLTREDFTNQRVDLWKELKAEFPDMVYSVKTGSVETPLGHLGGRQFMSSATDFEHTSSGPMALSSHDLDPKEPSDR